MGRRYYGISQSINNVEYQVELHSNAAALNAELTITSPRWEWDGESKRGYELPVMGSRVKVGFVMRNAVDYGNFVAIGTDEEQEWVIKILKSGSLFWVGRVVADQITYLREARETGYAIIELTAVDGLNLISGYSMENINFSIGDRQTVANTITQILQQAGLYAYWGASDVFLQDGIFTTNATSSARTMDGSIRDLAFIKNFDSFAKNPEWMTCREGLEAIMISFGAQIFHINGKYVVRQLPSYTGSSHTVGRYDYSGGFLSNATFSYRHTIEATSFRPRYEAFASQFSQPPVRGVDAIFDRERGEYDRKSTNNTTSISVDYTNATAGNTSGSAASLGYPVKVIFNFRFQYTNSVIKRWVLRYKIFARNPSSGDIYQYANGVWYFITNGTTVSAFNRMDIEVPQLYRTFTAYYEGTQSFEMPEPPTGATTVHAEFKVEEETATILRTGTPPSGSKIVWTTPTTTAKSFTGDIIIRQSYTNAEPVEYKQFKKYTSSLNSPRDLNSEYPEIRTYFYNGVSSDVGSYLAWNGSAYVAAGNWSAPWTTTVGDLPELLANQWAGVYSDFMPVIRGNLHDTGVYTPDLLLLADSTLWMFNGGNFDSSNDTWDAEWLGVQVVYTNVTDDGVIDRNPNDGEITQGKIEQTDDELSRLRQIMNNLGQHVQESMVNDGIGAPTSDPGGDRTYNIQLQYGYGVDPTLSWKLTEKSEIVKSADESSQSDAVLSNDSELQFTMEASKTYYIELVAFYSTSATPQFKYALTGPGTPTLVQVVRRHGNSTVTNGLDTSYTASTAITGMNNGFVEMKITIQTGMTGGTFAFQWAQNTSDVSQTKVLGGSYLKYLKQ